MGPTWRARSTSAAWSSSRQRAWTRRWRGDRRSPKRRRSRSRCVRSRASSRTDSSVPTVTRSEIEGVFREEYGRAVAVLARVFGDIDIAEEAVQDAFATAAARWLDSGLPPAPAGWIITTARNRAIDRLRRESSRAERHAQAALLHAGHEPVHEGAVPDDRLRLIFTCCHPSLALPAQVALTLRL